MQEVLSGDKQWAESSEGEQQVRVFHMHVPVGRLLPSVSGNTELGSTPDAGQAEQDATLSPPQLF